MLYGIFTHDPLASAILVVDDMKIAEATALEVEEQLAKLPRKEIAAQALAKQGKIIVAKDMETVIEMANLSAPEHLEINTKEPFAILPYIHNAGAIFLGAYSPEPLGDYYAGPNHILPTGGTARFYSVLNVETFMKKTSIIAYTEKALAAVSDDIIEMAEAEGLKAHGGEKSYTKYLFMSGQDKILKKVGEEAAETIIASKNNSNEEVIYEMSDLWYHCLVLLAYHNITPGEMLSELGGRRSKENNSKY